MTFLCQRVQATSTYDILNSSSLNSSRFVVHRIDGCSRKIVYLGSATNIKGSTIIIHNHSAVFITVHRVANRGRIIHGRILSPTRERNYSGLICKEVSIMYTMIYLDIRNTEELIWKMKSIC